MSNNIFHHELNLDTEPNECGALFTLISTDHICVELLKISGAHQSQTSGWTVRFSDVEDHTYTFIVVHDGRYELGYTYNGDAPDLNEKHLRAVNRLIEEFFEVPKYMDAFTDAMRRLPA